MRTCPVVLSIAFTMFAGASAADAQEKKADDDKYYVYVSVSGENRIAIYRLDPEDGGLTDVASVDVGGSPGSLAVDPKRQFLYAAIRSTGSVATLRIHAGGRLAPLGRVRVAGNPVYVATDRTGKFLLTAYYGDNQAAIYPINADGSVRAAATQTIPTGKNPHSINIDAKNRFVYIPNTGADRVLQYAFNARTGSLTPLPTPAMTSKPGAGPRHFYFHPANGCVYVVNEKNSSVTACRQDPKRGTLVAFQTLSTLPPGFKGKNTCADIEITPSGKYLYASNRGHDSLTGYKIDPKTGLLTSLGQTPTEKTPREFNIDPTGRYVFSAGQSSGKLAAYALDEPTGQLKPLKTYDVGKGPAWVLLVKGE